MRLKTMRELVKKVCDTLNIERHEAELIIATLLDRPLFSIYYKDVLDKNTATTLKMKLRQLQHGVPIEYITKRIQFMDLTLRVYPGVFIPRLETEYFVELIVKKMKKAPDKILDIGTGSGAISIALARVFPASTIISTDIAEHALACARENIDKYMLSKRIHLLRTNMLNGISDRFDLVVSNPPYIPFSRLQSLPKSVKYYEPLMALNGGENGTMFTKTMIEQCARVLMTGACMAIEIDEDAVSDLKGFLEYNSSMEFCFEKDLFDKYRYVFLEKNG